MKRMTWVEALSFIVALYLLAETIILWSQGPLYAYRVNTGLFCSAACLLPFAMRRLRLISLPAPMVIAVLAALFLHAYGVLFLQYDEIVVWDTVTHSVSSVTVAYCIFLTLLMVSFYDRNVKLSPLWAAVFVFMALVTMGAYWEIFEMLVDYLTGTAMQYSPLDTARDLACDAAAGALVSLHAYLYLRRHDGAEMVRSLELHPRLQALICRGSRRHRRASA